MLAFGWGNAISFEHNPSSDPTHTPSHLHVYPPAAAQAEREMETRRRRTSSNNSSSNNGHRPPVPTANGSGGAGEEEEAAAAAAAHPCDGATIPPPSAGSDSAAVRRSARIKAAAATAAASVSNGLWVGWSVGWDKELGLSGSIRPPYHDSPPVSQRIRTHHTGSVHSPSRGGSNKNGVASADSSHNKPPQGGGGSSGSILQSGYFYMALLALQVRNWKEIRYIYCVFVVCCLFVVLIPS
jgi:hypothetical protein